MRWWYVALPIFIVLLIVIIVVVVVLLKKKKGMGGSGGGGGPGAAIGKPIGNGSTGETIISFYGQSKADDNGHGSSGVDLFKMTGLTFHGNPVFPCAVHHDHIQHFLYKILRVEGKGVKPIQCMVLDHCNRKDASCSNYKKLGIKTPFLVDIHKLGFSAAGMSDGLTRGTYKVIGEMRPSQLPKNGWVSEYILCSCKDTCDSKSNQRWTKLADCK